MSVPSGHRLCILTSSLTGYVALGRLLPRFLICPMGILMSMRMTVTITPSQRCCEGAHACEVPTQSK